MTAPVSKQVALTPTKTVGMRSKSTKFRSAAQQAQPRGKELAPFGGHNDYYATRNMGIGYAKYNTANDALVGGIQVPLNAV